ncbi:MAG: phospho-N-acetylmuramoyl-pentapeptide-transferase [Epulopiscium sp.]|jgi:phospho-N-acetylmuramoyl-pentapeptide-transferase|nr:phospho-N-acetylmuramoyl-pentapeptide-transferase [Candidatus Epulonipiscium sp.]HOQ16544.1 phospho-N-acetylmuramoyl-pentapeptide-transferase [Defluviitaleaceae bacterium]HPT75866.1 phospho-N-acetylmuramoyl-pentapeptide-transferase [Defluviitaleaceae bacterium]
MYHEAIYAVLISFIINLILSPILIPFLIKLKFGQFVRDDGPKSHLKKAGTPTMGGIIILSSILLTSLLFIKGNRDGLAVLLVTLSFGIIGFIDDFIKVALKRSLGLKAYQKIVGQLFVSGCFLYYILNVAKIGTRVIIPFTAGREIDFGILFIPFFFIVMLGTVNGVNLTDGLDGLVSSVTVLIATFFTVVSWGENSSILPVAAAVVGSLLSFLLFNSYPAKVFMGDTGSLALGGFVVSTAFILKMPIFIAIVGMIYLIESISVMIQVAYFKATGKRVFKMAPIHHHFELSGWTESKVVSVFCIATAVACLIGFLGLN